MHTKGMTFLASNARPARSVLQVATSKPDICKKAAGSRQRGHYRASCTKIVVFYNRPSPCRVDEIVHCPYSLLLSSASCRRRRQYGALAEEFFWNTLLPRIDFHPTSKKHMPLCSSRIQRVFATGIVRRRCTVAKLGENRKLFIHIL